MGSSPMRWQRTRMAARNEMRDSSLHAQWKRAPWHRRTIRADKAYDVREFIEVTRVRGTTPHVTQNVARPGGSAIDARTTRHPGYAISQHARPRIEPAFGRLKTIAWMCADLERPPKFEHELLMQSPTTVTESKRIIIRISARS